MIDIVERLDDIALWLKALGRREDWGTMRDGIAEIERLREKIKQLNLLVDEREEQEAEIAGWKR